MHQIFHDFTFFSVFNFRAFFNAQNVNASLCLCNCSKGATGAVFQGVNKHNGEPVAVKTFNQVRKMSKIQ